ncbi:hypothetical protein P7D22_11520 [Lichenihabitans sp. Uapishka_5]|uniref:hypothetical protein n=1 Tax=Lichenihabitans sp. Uapishka_5 TaxID=3037302 RepID=UPI0029E7EBF7|nr:hypothetical protein [Lichenihabitans sp. Uapishka_5]MDX7951798.1 hypothetical protein [Lichenihabitans sp. Uapishka_5]
MAIDPLLTSAADDQPRVSWPGLDEPPPPVMAAEPQAEAPPAIHGRILPVLDEAGPPEPLPAAEPPPRPRKPARIKPAAVETAPPEADALYPAEPAAAQAEDEPAATTPDADAEPVDLALNAKAIAATLLQLQGKKRLPRDGFKRGERWKARLPAAALGSLRAARRPASRS